MRRGERAVTCICLLFERKKQRNGERKKERNGERKEIEPEYEKRHQKSFLVDCKIPTFSISGKKVKPSKKKTVLEKC